MSCGLVVLPAGWVSGCLCGGGVGVACLSWAGEDLGSLYWWPGTWLPELVGPVTGTQSLEGVTNTDRGLAHSVLVLEQVLVQDHP